ncbi:putative ankyrin repeat-containing domain, PGG domain-containing protein [Medicago truncatula]|uniref:Putative ankyrin repeat-containing domain, PGG domain-containing protein n=3 Tax=Medicago truncatula TaxID=3880 RepID=A0A396IRE0_MEDTR|nr:putative ankyrin repeat-containing domain, PGG domain-containing protein [Medicago truncatula]
MDELNSKVKASDKKGLLLVAMKELEAKKSDTNDTAYLRAAKHGITEIMLALESNLKSVIHETNSDNENALLIAVKYRQPQVVEGLWKRLSMETFQSINQQVDINENTILHLAAFTVANNENTAWRISGAAMQMMWDIKWYKYIKRLVPDHYHHRSNKEGKTPGEIFKEEHKELLQSSIEWLKDTSESCSVVAALVAGVSFATSGSVPGGNDQSGKPNFEGQPAFEVFSICSLIGLYFSVTALIMFLSILTSRKQVEDFNRNLPLKLLFGLSSLFVAIVAMFISFIAGHYFVLTDKYTKSGILFYLYIAICLPITFYGVVQFPLYLDLVKVTWRKVPPPSIKGVKL